MDKNWSCLNKSRKFLVIGSIVGALITGCGGGGGTGSGTPTPVTLASIAITPAAITVTNGLNTNFSATGTYSDASTADITSHVNWTSSNPAVATIDSAGLAATLSTGSTNLSASSSGITSSAAVLTVIPPPPPAAPINVFAVSGTNQVTVSWSPVSGATSYNIYWSTLAGITTTSTKIAGITEPYVHTGLTTGNTYYYRVSAVNVSGETLSDETFSFLYAGGNPAGIFLRTGDMHWATQRTDHTATLLPNGEVLVTGGYFEATLSGYSYYLSSPQIYNRVTETFRDTVGYSRIAASHTATLLSNGKVLLVGGRNNGTGIASIAGPLDTAEIYDPATGIFSATGKMTVSRSTHTATLLSNGKVLVTGGNVDTIAEIFDPATNSFSITGSMMTYRMGHTATLLPDGKVLVTGGSTELRAEIFDPATNSFSATGSMTTGRENHTATLLPNGKVLVTGGISTSGGGSGLFGSLSSAELYDPATGSFSSIGSLVATTGRGDTATLLSNGKVLIAGSISVYAQIYDPATNSFSVTGGMTTPRAYHTATLLPNGEVLVIGGYSGTIYLSSAELFQ